MPLVSLSWGAWALLALALTHVVIVLVTVYFHRVMAHRAVSVHPRVHRVCRFLSWFLIAMVPREFAAVHRKHHAHCDTPEDPHSPVNEGVWRVLWNGVGLYRREARNPQTLEHYGKGLPVDPWEGFYQRYPNLGVMIQGALWVGLLGGKGALLWAMLMLWIPLWAAGVVNGLGHRVGYRRFPTDDHSTNLWPWGVWLGGEELHNNHHAYPSSPKFSTAWYELDIGWGYIRLLCALGLAELREAPGHCVALPGAEAVTPGKRLQHILRGRYEWLAQLQRSLSHDARAPLRACGYRSWSQLSRAWDRAERLSPRQSQKLAQAQAHPVLQRLRTLEARLRAGWQERKASVEARWAQHQQWIHDAQQEALPRLSQFCDRLTHAQWLPRAPSPVG